MELAQVVQSGLTIIAVVLSLLAFIAGRSDKSGDKYAGVAKQVGELALQISQLRTELAQQELSRHKELEERFVSRREFEQRDRLIDFTHKLTLETHKRFNPDASIHEPGAMHG